mmetsp:Transcript_75/g.104  ORF Transcript_75/g.104 Transcript_75/m.104 type:complete len:299 (-) Transcript_75:618-1514(-)
MGTQYSSLSRGSGLRSLKIEAESLRLADSDNVVIGLLHEDFSRSLTIEEQGGNLLNLILADLELTKGLGQHERRVDQLDDVTQGGARADRSQVGQSVCLDFDTFGLAANGQNLHNLVKVVGQQANDEETVKQIDGDTVRAAHLGALDLANTTVGRQDDDRGQIGLQGSVHVSETLDVEHVDLIDEEHARHDLGATLLSPLGDLLVNLFSHFGLNLTDIASEERHEALSAGVDDIDFMEGHSVHDFLSLLQLALWALHESRLGTHVVKVGAAGEGATQLGDLAASLVDSDDVAGDNLLL